MNIIDKKIFIEFNINDLNIEHREFCLHEIILKHNDFDEKNVISKKIGTQIRFSNLNDEIINQLYDFIKSKIG